MKYIVAFTGVVGSSKTPIANYLSGVFGLPSFNADAVRSEVIEDKLSYDIPEVEKRFVERLTSLIKKGESFILDASIDRKFSEYKHKLDESGYELFLINLDLSREFLVKLYEAKGYDESLKRLDQLLIDHKKFLEEFGDLVNIRVDDNAFPGRLVIVEEALRSWLATFSKEV